MLSLRGGGGVERNLQSGFRFLFSASWSLLSFYFSPFLFYIKLFLASRVSAQSLVSVLHPVIDRSSHSDGQRLAHLLPDDFLAAVRTLPVVSRQRPSEPQQVPANREATQVSVALADTLNKRKRLDTTLLSARF